jgi:hypothetical protein
MSRRVPELRPANHARTPDPPLAEVRHLTPNSAIFEVESETSLVFAIAVLKKNQCSADLPS